MYRSHKIQIKHGPHYFLIENTARHCNTSNNNNNEILIKCEPLGYTRARHTVQKKKEKKKRLGQYNTNNKLIHGQPAETTYISHSLRPSPPLSLSLTHTHTNTLTHTHTHTPQQVK